MIGNVGIILLLLTTIQLWILSKPSLATITDAPFTAATQLAALLGTVLFSLTYVLATRNKVIERWFGGLDIVYKVHHIIGLLAVILLMAHPIFLGLRMIEFGDVAIQYFLPSGTLSYDLGILSLYSLLLLIALTLYVKLPYQIWLWSHKLMGAPLFLALIHAFLIPSDISLYLPLRLWIMGFIIIGIVTYSYKLFLYRFFGPLYSYKVAKVSTVGDITELYLSPNGKALKFLAGQFVYLSIKNRRGIKRELHPFTISSAPGAKKIRLSIKNLGNYSKSLAALKENDQVKLYGPYGRFGNRFRKKTKGAIFIAGGIGVTPFLSLLMNENDAPSGKEIDFFYCSNSEATTYDNEEMLFASNKTEDIRYHLFCSNTQGRIDANYISTVVNDYKERVICICGPIPMMNSLRKQFIGLGVNPRNIIIEDFRFL